MATQVGRVIRDQNLNVQCKGAPLGGKTNVSKQQKKGGLGGRKALNDISNSGKPSALQASRKHNSMNEIPIEEDFGTSKTAFSVGGKTNVSKAPEKVRVSGRKALSDLTNSGKPSIHQLSKKSHDKKLTAIAEEENLPSAIAEERFLHNHQECIKAQRKALDMDHFLKTVGLYNDISVQSSFPWSPLPLSRNLKPESPLKPLEMEEMSELLIEDQSPQSKHSSPPLCGSPRSPKLYMHLKAYNFPYFVLMEEETPELPNPFAT